MSTYTCDVCSFYTDKNNKFIAHLATLKHKQNCRNKTDIAPPTADGGQKNVQHRTLTRQNNTMKLVPQPPVEHKPEPPPQSVFTLLEIKDNQIISTKQVDISNSVISFV